MLFYDTLRGVELDRKTSVAMGFFDGLHKGHAAVISKAVQEHKQFLPVVFTFTMKNTRPAKKPPEGYELITNDDKRALLARWGVGVTVSPDFSEFCEMDAEKFVLEVLMRKLKASHVCCGKDFRFGKNANAGISELQRLCSSQGITVDAVEEVKTDNRRISSTWVRELLRDGNVKKAGNLLGRLFGYDFAVIEGKKLGRTIDFPTINQPIPIRFVSPKHGVYASLTYAYGEWRPSVTNVGLRPTVENTDSLNSETYICGFSGDLYGIRVPVRLLEFLRPEQKFDSVESLRRQIGTDAVEAVKIAMDALQNNKVML